jgi:hypothetical protein
VSVTARIREPDWVAGGCATPCPAKSPQVFPASRLRDYQVADTSLPVGANVGQTPGTEQDHLGGAHLRPQSTHLLAKSREPALSPSLSRRPAVCALRWTPRLGLYRTPPLSQDCGLPLVPPHFPHPGFQGPGLPPALESEQRRKEDPALFKAWGQEGGAAYQPPSPTQTNILVEFLSVVKSADVYSSKYSFLPDAHDPLN